MPHDIIRVEMGAAPIITEVLFRSETYIQCLWELPKRRNPRLALGSSRQLAKNGDTHCWYVEYAAMVRVTGHKYKCTTSIPI